LAHHNKQLEELMLAFSSGGFLYLATVSILPDIVREKSGPLQTTLELLAFVCGIAMMVVVAVYE
jgi:zinc transporter 7